MRSVFVTGAASGIGLAIAREFSKAGWFVGLYDLDGERCVESVDAEDFPAAIAGHCDVTDRESVTLDHSNGPFGSFPKLAKAPWMF